MGDLKYDIEIEIFRGLHCDHHTLGEKFNYPDDIGCLCPWLLDSISTMIRVLQFGGSLPWGYEDSEFEKMIDNNGISTEFVRCPDPTDAGVVVKITRRKRLEARSVGWA